MKKTTSAARSKAGSGARSKANAKVNPRADSKANAEGRADSPDIGIPPETRFHLINDAAYFRGLQKARADGGAVDHAGAWCEVEAEIDAVIRKHSR